MFVELSCKCGSVMQLDGINESYTMLMTSRFAESHTDCGFVTPLNNDQPKTTRRDVNIKPKAFTEDDED